MIYKINEQRIKKRGNVEESTRRMMLEAELAGYTHPTGNKLSEFGHLQDI